MGTNPQFQGYEYSPDGKIIGRLKNAAKNGLRVIQGGRSEKYVWRPLEEDSQVIADFPDYEVTTLGRVFNLRSGREMQLTQVTGGAMTVGLMRDGWQYRRSVKVLVAQEFVDGENSFNDTPILLDGDEENLSHANIRWRSRGFAWEYKRQFTDPPERAFLGPVVDVTNGYRYETVMDAAVVHGALCRDILRSIYEWTVEPYTGIKYAWLDLYSQRVLDKNERVG